MRYLWIILALTASIGWAQPPASTNEVAISRWASENPGLYYREFDLPGAKAEYFRGTSVQGSPDLYAPRLGVYQPSRRLPEQLSGLYSARPIWDPWQIGLNGENGQFIDPSGLETALDTPVTRLDWQRTAFTGNSLKMDFQRSLVDSVFFDLGVASHSTDSSGSFRYQDITHQPYLGTMKRDSSRVPLSGRNLAFDTFLMHPRIIWHTANFSLGASLVSLHIRNDETTRHYPIADSVNQWQNDFVYAPYTIRSSLDGIGVEGALHMSKFWNASVWHRQSNLNNHWVGTPQIAQNINPRVVHIPRDTIEEQIVPAHDTTVYDTSRSPAYFYENSETQSGEAKIGLPLLHTELVLQYESRIFSKWRDAQFQDRAGEKWDDRQIGYASWADSLAWRNSVNQARVQLGMQRNSSILDHQDYEPAISIQALSRIANKVEVSTAARRHQRFPDAEELWFNRTGQVQFANPNLEFESHEAIEAGISFKRPSFQYGISVRNESTTNAIRPGWVAHPKENTLPDSTAFKWVNISELDNTLWRSFAGLRLGNWQFWMERESSLHRKMTLHNGKEYSRISDIPARTYKGTILWNNLVVNGKLRLDIRWDFEWIGPHDIFGLVQDTRDEDVDYATRSRVPQNLVLNFEARMTIRTFSLYARIDNLNHTKLEPAAGYTPPGVSFRYGIQWSFKD